MTLWLLATLALVYLIAPLVELLLAEPWSQVPAALSDPLALDATRVSALAGTITTALLALVGEPLA